MKKRGLFTAVAFTTATLLSGIGMGTVSASAPTATVSYTTDGSDAKVTLTSTDAITTYYSVNGKKSWNTYSAASFDVTSLLKNKDVEFYVDMDANHTGDSEVTKVTLKAIEAAPKGVGIAADYKNEQLKATVGYQYKRFGDSSWTTSTADTASTQVISLVGSEAGESILFRKAATATAPASATAVFKVPAKPGAPKLKLNANSDVVGVTDKMQYATTDSLNWINIVSSDITNKVFTKADQYIEPNTSDATTLGDTKTVYIRTTGDDKKLASAAQKITIYPQAKELSAPELSAATLTHIASKAKFTTGDDMEYTVLEGDKTTTDSVAATVKWTKLKTGIKEFDFSKALNGKSGTQTLFVRTSAVLEVVKSGTTTAGKSSSKIIKVSITEGETTPAVSATKDFFSFTDSGAQTTADNIAAKYEVSADKGKTWTGLSTASSSSYKGKKVHVRLKATATTTVVGYPSKAVEVSVPK